MPGRLEQSAEAGAVLRGVDGDQDVRALLVAGAQGAGVEELAAQLGQGEGVQAWAAHPAAAGREHVVAARAPAAPG